MRGVISPALLLALLAGSLLVAVAGLRVLVNSWYQQGLLSDRTGLARVERRARGLRGRLESSLRRTELGRDLLTRLVSAGVEVRLVDFLLVSGGVGVLAFVAANFLLPWWMAAIAGAATVRSCWSWVERKRNERRERFLAQLPDIARVLSNASLAGLSMATAIEMAARELDEPAASEMLLVQEELALGQPIEAALKNLERRMPARDAGVLVGTLIIQQRAGGDLVRALQDMADTLETRKDLRREVRTLLAGSVFTGYLVAAMGIVALVLVNVLSPGAIDKLSQRLAGQVALLASFGLYALGFILVRRTTRIDV